MRLTKFLKLLLLGVAVTFGVVTSPVIMAQKHIKQNLTQLVNTSASILSGEVLNVNDGFDSKKRPYTEVSIRVSQDAKGKQVDDSLFTFRQFGLIKPRSMGNGKVYLGVSPEGFPRWQVGEKIIAFMNPDFGGGLNSITGLEQGKFNIRNGKVINQVGNLNLFKGIDTTGFSAEELSLTTQPGAIDAAAFVSLIGKLVKENK